MADVAGFRRQRDYQRVADTPEARNLTRQLRALENNTGDALALSRIDGIQRFKVLDAESASNQRIVSPGQALGIRSSVSRVALERPRAKDAGKLTAIYKTELTPSFTSIVSEAKINGSRSYTFSATGILLLVNDGTNYYTTETRRLFDVTLFGASPSASAAVNTSAFQAAFDAASAAWLTTGVVQSVHVPAGLYRMLLDSAVWWTMPLNGSATEFHGAVALRSGVSLVCDEGTTFVPVAPVGANAAWYYAIFASEDIYITVGDLEQVSFIRPNFEFGATYWDATLPSVFGIMAVGIYDLAIKDGVGSNANANSAGRFARCMNCELWNITATTTDVVQSLYLSYMRQGSFSVKADGFTEAVDIDQSCWNITGKVSARNGTGEGQVLDISSVQDGNFEIDCENVGNAFILYPKPECWETFGDWVTNFPLGSAGWSPNPVMVKRVTVNVTGRDVHHPTELRCFQVALDRTDAGWGGYWDGKGAMCEDVTIRAKFKDTDGALVYECKNIDLAASLTDVTTSTVARVNNAAVTLRAARTGATAIAESELSGRARVYVKNSTRIGVRVSKPTDLDLECEVDGYNSADDASTGVASGVWVEDLARKSTVETITIRNMRVKNGDATVDPTDLRLTWDGGASATYVRDQGGHKLSTVAATQPMRVATFGFFLGANDLRVAFDTTAATPVDIPLGVVRSPGARLAAAHILNEVAIVGNAVDFSDLSVRRLRAGVTSGAIGTAQNYDNVNRAAGALVELGIDGTDSDGVLQNGDVLVLRAVRHGVGSARTGLWVRFTLVEYAI